MPHANVSLFSQLLALIDRNTFHKIVNKHQSDKYNKGINTWTHLVSMLFMQFADVTSLRDITNGLRSATGNLKHLGVNKAPSRSSISYINKNRSYKVFEDLYFALLERFEPSLRKRRLYANRIKRKVFIMDSSIIPLALSLFDWAKFRTHKGGIKLHAVLDYDTGLPAYACLSEAKKHDVKQAKELVFPSDSVLVIDRAYVDFEWLFYLDSCQVSFVTRIKKNTQIQVLESFLTNDKHQHILSDEDIRLTGFYTSKKYPKTLRIVKVYDEQKNQTLLLLTNNLSWTADTISQLYKLRWDIESFFKYLKQLFRVKTFVGTSANAVQIQMWCSMIAILLFKYLKNKAKYPWHFSNLVTFLRINLFVKINLWQWLDMPIVQKAKPPPQQNLFSTN